MQENYAAFFSLDGGKKWRANAFSAREDISQVPVYSITLSDADGSCDDFLGKTATISLPETSKTKGITPRTFQGIVTDIEFHRDHNNAFFDRRGIKITVRPFLALLSYSVSNCIYQNKSCIDIVKNVLDRNGLKRAKLSVSATPPKREFCIQYDENDLEFISRILAEDGIVYYFLTDEQSQTLMLHDSNKPFPKAKSGDVELTDPSHPDPTLFNANELKIGRGVVAGKVSLSSYDVAKAARAISGQEPARKSKLAVGSTVTEHKPIGGAEIKADAKILARHMRSSEDRLRATTDHPALYLGQQIQLLKVADADLKGFHTITSLDVSAQNGMITNTFLSVPKDVAFLPQRPKSRFISGVHNAVVVGGDEGTPVCDGQGRVKVKFYWDNDTAQKDTSCWIRVAQSYAGNGYGEQFTPRVGQEVLVSFINGNPDYPIITGRVYNAKNPPPFGKTNTTISGISTKLKGDPNEVLFDDAKGKERFVINAAKDYFLNVNDSVTVKVDKDEAFTIKGDAQRDIGKSYDVNVQKDMKLDAQTITLSGKSSIVLKVGGSSIELTPSGVTIKGTKVTVQGTQIDAKGSASFKIAGGTGTVQATGPLGLKGAQLTAEGSVMATLKGSAMASVEASGMAQVKGAIVKVN